MERLERKDGVGCVARSRRIGALGVLLACAGALGLAGCRNSCEKLAEQVCARGVDARLCAESKTLARGPDQAARARCRASLKSLDEYVLDRQMALKLRDLFERFEKTPPAPTSLRVDGGAGRVSPDAGP